MLFVFCVRAHHECCSLKCTAKSEHVVVPETEMSQRVWEAGKGICIYIKCFVDVSLSNVYKKKLHHKLNSGKEMALKHRCDTLGKEDGVMEAGKGALC